MRRGVADSISERLSVLTDFYPWYGDVEVLIKVQDMDHEISVVWFRNFYILEKDIVGVGMNIDDALGRRRWFHGSVARSLKGEGGRPLRCVVNVV